MNFNPIASHQSKTSYSNTVNLNSKPIPKRTFSINETVMNNPKLQESDSTNIWNELSNKYNVRKATFHEIKEISNELYNAGEISLKDVAVLTFDYDKATNYLKRNAPVTIDNSFDMYETSSNNKGERDWILEFNARAQKDLKYGNLIGYNNNIKILHILQQLDNE